MILGITGAPRRGKVGSLGCSGCVPPSVRRRLEHRARCRPALAKSAGCRSTLESGIRSAVFIRMRQQPGPMLIFRLSKDRRGRLDVRRHASNPHSVPGGPVILLWRHHEQLKNTAAVRGHTLQPRPAPGIEPTSCAMDIISAFPPAIGRIRVEALGTSYSPVYVGR
jgi:hypothetical protein